MVGMRSKYPLNLLLLASWEFQQPVRLKNKESKKTSSKLFNLSFGDTFVNDPSGTTFAWGIGSHDLYSWSIDVDF